MPSFQCFAVATGNELRHRPVVGYHARRKCDCSVAASLQIRLTRPADNTAHCPPSRGPPGVTIPGLYHVHFLCQL